MDIDEKTTNKVLEALSLQMQETSMSKEITAIDAQLQLIASERDKLEKARNQCQSAQSSALQAAKFAKDSTTTVERLLKEARLYADKAFQAAKEAESFSAIVSKPLEFTKPLEELANTLKITQAARKEMSIRLAEVKSRREALRKEGVDINLDRPSRTITM